MKPRSLADYVAPREQEVATPAWDGRCHFEHNGQRCPHKPAHCHEVKSQKAGEGMVRVGPALCPAHWFFRKDVGASRVFLALASAYRDPYVPSWNDALVARRMLETGSTHEQIRNAYGPRMVPWLEQSPEHGKQGGVWGRDYIAAVKSAVRAAQLEAA